MSDINKDSLAWIGYSRMAGYFKVNNEQAELGWTPILAEAWMLVAEAIVSEAIRRDRKERSLAEAIAPKPTYGNFQEITRIMGGG